MKTPQEEITYLRKVIAEQAIQIYELEEIIDKAGLLGNDSDDASADETMAEQHERIIGAGMQEIAAESLPPEIREFMGKMKVTPDKIYAKKHEDD